MENAASYLDKTIDQVAAALEGGLVTAQALMEATFERIEAPGSEAPRTFVKLYKDQALESAAAMDRLRHAGRAPGAYAGIPISLKDLVDVKGEPTPAGSKVLADAPPATAHAPVVRRLLAAGFVPVGRTNMTEFAFSGLGINPHYGTPKSVWQREEGHIPGGSSSGAAVSVADGMAFMGLGTDTGGSCRIPAAFNGIVGYKPTARRVPLGGVVPLAPSLDSIGPLARSVSCCAVVDAVLAGADPAAVPEISLRGLRLAVPGNMVMEGLDASTSEAFNRALNRLDNLGVRVTHLPVPAFDEIAAANAGGGFAAVEAFAWHQKLMEQKGDGYDPRVRVRIERGRDVRASAHVALMAERQRIIASFDAALDAYDAVVMPTCPIAPPAIASLTEDAAYTRVNALVLRNCSLGNFLDRCAISLPCHREGEAPAGFMMLARPMEDARLFAMAAAIAPVLTR